MWTEVGRRGREGGVGLTTRDQPLRAPHMCMRAAGHCARPSRPLIHQSLRQTIEIRGHQRRDLRALTKAGYPPVKEPPGLVRSDGKRPDGLTLIPWRAGRSLVWDATVADTLAASYLANTSTTAGYSNVQRRKQPQPENKPITRNFPTRTSSSHWL